jgi:hypothetical protein
MEKEKNETKAKNGNGSSSYMDSNLKMTKKKNEKKLHVGESRRKGAKPCADIPLKLFFEFSKNHHGNTIYQKKKIIF